MKLLSRSIQSYLFYAIGILVIAIPLFYFVIQRIISDDVDRALRLQRAEIVSRIERLSDRDPFAILDAFGPDIIFNRLQVYHTYDSLYTVKKFNSATQNAISYRILESNILIRGLPYKIVVQNSLVSSQDLIKSIVMIMALLLLSIITGMLWINRRLSRKLWYPFKQTLYNLKQYRVDSPDPVVLQKTAIDEFADLNSAVATLSENNRRLFLLQKEFTENASHEMQTPLAVLQGKLELLMQTEPITEHQAQLIEALSDAAQRLGRLNKALLLLTRIENNQFADKEDILIDEVLKNLLAQFEAAIESKLLSVNAGPVYPTRVKMNGTLAEILLGNLINNAIRHNRHSGMLSVSLEQRVLTVSNSGQPEPLDETKIYTRFHKSSTDKNSVGLGLEMVKKVCMLNKFALRYRFEYGLHCFSVHFDDVNDS